MNIVLGVTGSIAAYKACEIARGLKAHDVRVVMTASARAFVGELSFQAITGHRVHTDLLDAEAEAAMGHIELARWAEAILVAPASANMIAKLSHGFADDLLSTLCLASKARLVIAPAMNQQMWAHPLTQENLTRLRALGAEIIEPEDGEQACGDIGPGRLAAPESIVAAVLR